MTNGIQMMMEPFQLMSQSQGFFHDMLFWYLVHLGEDEIEAHFFSFQIFHELEVGFGQPSFQINKPEYFT